MTSPKDFVEAHLFSRRRLVAAFVSGARGGEVETTGPGRALAAGLVIAVLLATGVRVVHALRPGTATGGDVAGVVIGRESGARYLVTGQGGALRPLPDLTSAQLILGMDYPVTIVADSGLAGRAPGTAVGIPGAPPQLPPATGLIASGWTACTSAGAGIAVTVSANPAVTPATGRGALVRSGAREYVVADGRDGYAHAFEVSSGLGAQALFAPSTPTGPATRVPARWLALLGRPLTLRVPAGVRTIRSSAGYDAVSAKGGLVRAMSIPPFAARLIAHGDPPRAELPAGARPDDHLLDDTTYRSWPDDTLEASPPGPLCAQLHAQAGQASSATLVAPAGSGVWPGEAPTTGAAVLVRVDPGAGAFVRTAPPRGHGTTYLIASTGWRYHLAEPRTLEVLGLASYATPVVAPSWLALFPVGPDLSRRAALCGPAGGGRC